MSNPSKHYQALPRIDSPRHLDDQILSEAARLAPTPVKSPRWLSSTGWMSLAATASVIGLTVFVIRPGLDIVSSDRHHLEPQTPRVEETVSLAEENSGAAYETIQSLAVAPKVQHDAQISQPAATLVESPKPSVVAPSVVAGAVQAEQTLAEERANEPESLNVELSSSLSQPLARAKTTLKTAAPLLANTINTDGQTTDQANETISKQELADQLAQIQRLVDDGREAEAIRALQDLIKRCPGCDIPPAITRFRSSKD